MTRLFVADASPFRADNLPYGVYSLPGRAGRIATRLGDTVIDIGGLIGESGDNAVFTQRTLNAFMAQGHNRWAQVRARLAEAVTGNVPDDAVYPVGAVTMQLPFAVADYVDFYASEHHAANLGRLFRPDSEDPLTPNWKHLPIAYHGRPASIVVSGTDIVRPSGQRKGPRDAAPTFGPSLELDIEAELGFVVGTGNRMGEPSTRSDVLVAGSDARPPHRQRRTDQDR